MSEYCDSFFLAIVCFAGLLATAAMDWMARFPLAALASSLAGHGFGTQTDRSSDTVISCITTTDDQNIFSFCKFIWNFAKSESRRLFVTCPGNLLRNKFPLHLFPELECLVEAPQARITRSKFFRISSAVISFPTFTLVTNFTPSSFHQIDSSVNNFLSSFMLGIP